jgi:hypothetical protein
MLKQTTMPRTKTLYYSLLAHAQALSLQSPPAFPFLNVLQSLESRVYMTAFLFTLTFIYLGFKM